LTENELKNVEEEQMAIEKGEQGKSENPPSRTNAAASVEGQQSANTVTAESVSHFGGNSGGTGQIVPKEENNFGTNIQKQMDLTDQKLTEENETPRREDERREDETAGESAVKLESANINAIDLRPKGQHMNAGQSGAPKTTYKHQKKYTRSQHTQLIWQPKKGQEVKDPHEIDPKNTEQVKKDIQPKDPQPIEHREQDIQPKDQQSTHKPTKDLQPKDSQPTEQPPKHLQTIEQPSKDPHPKDQQPTGQHADEHIGLDKNALLIKGYRGDFGKLIKLQSKF
jgi:hypothetical protein